MSERVKGHLGGLIVLILFAAMIISPYFIAHVMTRATWSEDIHAGVVKDCGDGKTFTKLGPKWKAFPVTYYIDAPTEFVPSIVASFREFEKQEHPAGAFFAAAVGPGAQIDLVFAPIDGPGNVLGRASYSWNPATKAFIEVNIVFDIDEAWVVLSAVQCNGAGIDVQAVTTHELGHAVGLGHSSSSTALTMYPFYGGGSRQRTLATGDVKGFDALY